MARRHVVEGERHITRQEKLLARLSEDDRHAALAVQAGQVLAVLKNSLRLAREHLATELTKPAS